MRVMAVGWLALAAALVPALAAAADAAVAPFTAEYDVRYGRIPGGTSHTALAKSGDGWVLETAATATGLARVVAPATVLQRSEFEVVGEFPRPLRYLLDDGTKRTDRDVRLEFDWRAGRVHGIAEEMPVDLPLLPGLQDAATLQVLVTARLRAGQEPDTIAMIEKGQVKHYRYTLLRREKGATALGEFDTLVYRSTRDGSSRETISWHAPALGFGVVQAQQLVRGKLGFNTRIRSFKPG